MSIGAKVATQFWSNEEVTQATFQHKHETEYSTKTAFFQSRAFPWLDVCRQQRDQCSIGFQCQLWRRRKLSLGSISKRSHITSESYILIIVRLLQPSECGVHQSWLERHFDSFRCWWWWCWKWRSMQEVRPELPDGISLYVLAFFRIGVQCSY